MKTKDLSHEKSIQPLFDICDIMLELLESLWQGFSIYSHAFSQNCAELTLKCAKGSQHCYKAPCTTVKTLVLQFHNVPSNSNH